jgi:lysophospholipase L1-like esterase
VGQAEALKYLALGDSYTIGTGTSDPANSWPSILAARLTEAMGREVELTNPAVNGFTTDDLIQYELPLARSLKPNFTTILIGVNDLVRGKTPNRYHAMLVRIYDEVAAVIPSGGKVAAVSIPTWSYVPAAADYGGAKSVARLTDLFNSIAEGEALGHQFTWIDITEASRSGIGRPGWIASDGLHPGNVQYAAWADTIWQALGESWAASSG